MKFGDLVGYSKPAPDDLATFLKAWFRADDTILVGAFITPGTEIAQGRTAREFVAYGVEELINDYQAVYDAGYGAGGGRDIYFRFTPIKDRAKVEVTSPGKDNSGSPLGLWADFDVKPGAFNSQQDILTWLGTLELQPTITVRNGSAGGIHAYWRVKDADLPRLAQHSEHLAMWWSYLQAQAPNNAHGERIQIDRLTDIKTRLARLPGMAYWPKSTGAKIGTVALAGGIGAQVSLDDVERLSGATFADYRELTEATRRQARKADKHLERNLSPLKRLALEQRINQMSWEEILFPHGWTVRNSHDTTRHWTRPGSDQKSATSDYTHPDGTLSEVLSLHSGAEETGLLDLKQAGLPLTKMRVLLRLSYADNVSALLQDITNSSDTSLGGKMSDKEINYNENPTHQ